jgi:acyl-CoA synthetase (AMP-forming)/AMP-acid ligase II
VKDVIICGGENIDSVTVENALYADARVSAAAVVGVPDRRLGELVAAVVVTRPAFHGQVTEVELILAARKRLPKFAVPVMVVVRSEPLAYTPSGKILKTEVRKIARAEWEARVGLGVGAVAKL